MIDGGSVAVAILLVDGGTTIRSFARVAVSLIDGGGVMVTVLLENSGSVVVRLLVALPPPPIIISPAALGYGRVVVVAALLLNVDRTVIGCTPVDALLDVGLIIVAALLANGVGIVVAAALCDGGRVAGGTGLVDGQCLVIARHVDRDGAVVCNHVAAHAIKGREDGKVKQVSVHRFMRVSVHDDTSVFV